MGRGRVLSVRRGDCLDIRSTSGYISTNDLTDLMELVSLFHRFSQVYLA